MVGLMRVENTSWSGPIIVNKLDIKTYVCIPPFKRETTLRWGIAAEDEDVK